MRVPVYAEQLLQEVFARACFDASTRLANHPRHREEHLDASLIDALTSVGAGLNTDEHSVAIRSTYIGGGGRGGREKGDIKLSATFSTLGRELATKVVILQSKKLYQNTFRRLNECRYEQLRPDDDQHADLLGLDARFPGLAYYLLYNPARAFGLPLGCFVVSPHVFTGRGYATLQDAIDGVNAGSGWSLPDFIAEFIACRTGVVESRRGDSNQAITKAVEARGEPSAEVFISFSGVDGDSITFEGDE